MKHARPDYDRIQDPHDKIPKDEPVFLLRGQDLSAPKVLDYWAELNEKNGGEQRLSVLARRQAECMRVWQRDIKKKAADS